MDEVRCDEERKERTRRDGEQMVDTADMVLTLIRRDNERASECFSGYY